MEWRGAQAGTAGGRQAEHCAARLHAGELQRLPGSLLRTCTVPASVCSERPRRRRRRRKGAPRPARPAFALSTTTGSARMRRRRAPPTAHLIQKYTQAPVKRYESRRSSRPPWPGIRLDASFRPAPHVGGGWGWGVGGVEWRPPLPEKVECDDDPSQVCQRTGPHACGPAAAAAGGGPAHLRHA